VAGSRKNGDATGCGKAASHSPDDYARLTKIEHPLFYEKGTFLMSVDTPLESLRQLTKGCLVWSEHGR
jgi:hypothetical protein